MPWCDFTLRHGCSPVNLLHFSELLLLRTSAASVFNLEDWKNVSHIVLESFS